MYLPFGSGTAASWANRPIDVIGTLFDTPLAGTSNTYPCFLSSVFGVFVKSGPTSGPLTVSSHVNHDPHGVIPPAQFICVPFSEM